MRAFIKTLNNSVSVLFAAALTLALLTGVPDANAANRCTSGKTAVCMRQKAAKAAKAQNATPSEEAVAKATPVKGCSSKPAVCSRMKAAKAADEAANAAAVAAGVAKHTEPRPTHPRACTTKTAVCQRQNRSR